MSHSKIRSEKICLNCGASTPDRYCPVCGQENIEPRQSAWHLVTHFFSDITHFDGKFFTTVKDLFQRPGFLSREYMSGRRASYLDPIRMYIFTSAFFFIIFFSVVDVKKMHIGFPSPKTDNSALTLNKMLADAETAEDSAGIRKAFAYAKPGQLQGLMDSINKKNAVIMGVKEDYHSVAQYDSVQLALPAAKRDSWWKKMLRRKGIELSEQSQENRPALIREWLASFLHNFPKMLFLSLPLFALLLKLLYVRRKQFYYVDHGIFAVHLYIFSFLILLLYFGVKKLGAFTGWGWMVWIEIGILLFPLWYFYKAMRVFYGQGRMKTILKHFLLFCTSLLLQIFLFILFFLLSIFEL